MGRKVFLSVLGANYYEECIYTYQDEDFRSSLTRYIQCATLEKIDAKKWDNSCAGYILVTPAAFSANWDKSITEKKTRNGVVPYTGLEKAIEDMDLPFSINPLPITDGKTEQEISEIFLKVYKELKKEDDLYIDLTHGFRYLPMLMLVLANYAKFTLHATCQSFTYGNYELGETIDKIRVAPIIDLKSLSLIQDWTDAAEHLFFSGNTKKIKDLATEKLKQTQGKDTQYQVLKKLVGPLDNMTKDMKTCQGLNLVKGDHIKDLKNQLDKLNRSDLPAVFRPILNIIDKEFSLFQNDGGWKNGIWAAKWCLDHQQYQQAITLLRESIVTGICLSKEFDYTKESDRNYISNLLAVAGKLCSDAIIRRKNNKVSSSDSISIIKDMLIDEKYLNDNNWGNLSIEDKSLVISLVEDPEIKDLVNIYYEGRNARNQYNHAGMLVKVTEKGNTEKPLSADTLIKHIETRVCDADLWMTVFVNFSNHTSSGWTNAQTKAAKSLGYSIIDLPFPNISEIANENEITSLCDEYLQKIDSIVGKKKGVIHIMGEMTFTYAMVNLLKSHGYTCVASTTKRIVEELPDGVKNVKFEFCQFREY